MEIIKIKTEYIKLDQLLKFSNVISSGGTAKLIIKDGFIKVNNEICTMRGKKIRSGDVVEINYDEKIILKIE